MSEAATRTINDSREKAKTINTGLISEIDAMNTAANQMRSELHSSEAHSRSDLQSQAESQQSFEEKSKSSLDHIQSLYNEIASQRSQFTHLESAATSFGVSCGSNDCATS